MKKSACLNVVLGLVSMVAELFEFKKYEHT